LSTVGTPRAVDVGQVLRDPLTPRTSWSISDVLAVELARFLERSRPQRILEIGSGLSTVVLGAYAVRRGASVVTLEHAWKYYQPVRQALGQFGMDQNVKLKLAPLRLQRFERYGGRAPWYDTRLTGQFDFVFVDGPPKIQGRRAVLFAIAEHLAPGWELWLDDAHRWHERKCLRLWQQQFPKGFCRVQRHDVDGKGVALLSDASARSSHSTAPRRPPLDGKLGIALVANGDPRWPRYAERCLGRDLLLDSYVVVTTQEAGLVDELPDFVDRLIPQGRQAHQARRRAFQALASRPEVRYVLHLDDYWSNRTLDETWLSRALEILDWRSDIDLVCLRHWIDSGHQHVPHQVERGFVELGDQPFPDAPSLFRADVLPMLARQATDRKRRRFQIRRQVLCCGTVQLFPGVFRRRVGAA
jgi:hypothetical protein